MDEVYPLRWVLQRGKGGAELRYRIEMCFVRAPGVCF